MNLNHILKILISVLIILFISTLKINATDEFIQGAEDFWNAGKNEVDVLNSDSIKEVSDILFNFFSIIGTATVLIIGAILGIKFIMGSIEEQVKVKETLKPYLISSIVIFGAFGIWALFVNILQNIF